MTFFSVSWRVMLSFMPVYSHASFENTKLFDTFKKPTFVSVPINDYVTCFPGFYLFFFLLQYPNYLLFNVTIFCTYYLLLVVYCAAPLFVT